MRKLLFISAALLACIQVQAQYAPQANVAGSDAIPAASPHFVAWAVRCHIDRGLKQIDDASLGYAEVGDSTAAYGMPDGSVVSLGDSGRAVLTFANPIINGPGADFAVFENGFPNPANAEEAFLEFAFTEVSSDGVHFFRFPAASLTPLTTQVPAAGTYMNARLVNNLAGKYIGNFGTPFDLQELAGLPGLNVNHITHVRLVDVIGSVGAHACLDASGRKINDPFTTPFPGSGFDLDAVGVIHQLTPSAIPGVNKSLALNVYPNPSHGQLTVTCLTAFTGKLSILLSDATGRVLITHTTADKESILSLDALSAGIYYLTVRDENGQQWAGKVFRQ